MVQHKTARRIMYEWHSGQWSPLYAAASSGLVACFDALKHECSTIDNPDRDKLMVWLEKQAQKRTRYVFCGSSYTPLPWVSRPPLDNIQKKVKQS